MDNNIITYGIPDKEFIRGNVPMTKEEVRTITLSKLRLRPSDHLLDIGAGTGSISVEAARLLKGGLVYAVEHEAEAISLIRQNSAKFGSGNIRIIEGTAPSALQNIDNISKVVIGGTGGHLNEILQWVHGHALGGARVVVNAITMETLLGAQQFFRQRQYRELEIIQVAITRFETVNQHTMMRANTPVFIISATKNE